MTDYKGKHPRTGRKRAGVSCQVHRTSAGPQASIVRVIVRVLGKLRSLRRCISTPSIIDLIAGFIRSPDLAAVRVNRFISLKRNERSKLIHI
jgi:hypothetical protein